MYSPNKRLRVLRLVLSVDETTASYNQFTLPLADRQSIALCVYFEPHISIPNAIEVFAGNNSLRGFFSAIKEALSKGEYDIIHTHSPHVAFFAFVAAILFRKMKIRSILHTVHSSYSNYKFRNRLMLFPALAFFPRIVFCSNSSLESFPKALRWLVGNRGVVIQNGFDLDRVDRIVSNNPEQTQNNLSTVVVVGRLIDLKNPLVVLRAFKAAGDHVARRLVFIGDGELRDSIIAESKRLGIEDNVSITGIIPRDEVFNRLSQATLFVSASSVEGLPVAVLEAMACRCPVILSDIPPHREIVGKVGLAPLVQPTDVERLALEIENFYRLSSAERRAIGDKCRVLVEERFSLARMHQEYEKQYEAVG